MRGPNPDKYLDADHVSVAWSDMPEQVLRELAQLFPCLTDADFQRLADIYADYASGMADAGEISFRQGSEDREQAISILEQVTDKIARAISALPDQRERLEHVFNLVVQAQIDAKQNDPGKVAVRVLSQSEVKQIAARELTSFAESKGLDARALVRVMRIHEAFDARAWEKWYFRCTAK